MIKPRTLTFIAALTADIMIIEQLQAQSISINFEQKVIYTDSLNLPQQTPINTVLNMMSELLQRHNDVLFSNYDIQVNGMSVGAASEVALYQLDIQDVEKVEISESPTSSYQKNGQGGTINMTLRKQSTENKDYWGSAGISISYPTAFDPQVHFGYHRKNFYLSALALSDIYKNTNNSENLTFVNDKIQDISTTEFSEHYRSQLASLMMEYRPTGKDLFKLSLTESYIYGKEVNTPNYQAEMAKSFQYHNTNLQANLTYEHYFKRSQFHIETQYNYTPQKEKRLTPEVFDFGMDHSGHSVSGKLEYISRLMKPSSTNKLNLGVGSNFNDTHNRADLDFINMQSTTNDVNYMKPENRNYFVQPYAFLEAKAGKFRMKLTGEFQHFKYNITKQYEDFKATSNDLTGQAIVEWHFASNHTLRLLGVRALQRPGADQLFPFLVYDPNNMRYVQGDKDLTPAMTHEFRIDFISDQHWGEHTLHYDANISYKHVRDLIEQNDVKKENTGGLGATLTYLTYQNSGKNDIVSGNLMALYSYKSFAVSLTSNIFHNKQRMQGGNDHYTYYNISLAPHFNLKDGWQGSFEVIYNSSVETEDSRLSDCTQIASTIGKRWKDLYIYVTSRLALQKDAKNTSWSQNIQKVYKYEMIPNLAGFGLKYIF